MFALNNLFSLVLCCVREKIYLQTWKSSFVLDTLSLAISLVQFTNEPFHLFTSNKLSESHWMGENLFYRYWDFLRRAAKQLCCARRLIHSPIIRRQNSIKTFLLLFGWKRSRPTETSARVFNKLHSDESHFCLAAINFSIVKWEFDFFTLTSSTNYEHIEPTQRRRSGSSLVKEKWFSHSDIFFTFSSLFHFQPQVKIDFCVIFPLSIYPLDDKTWRIFLCASEIYSAFHTGSLINIQPHTLVMKIIQGFDVYLTRSWIV